MDSILARGGCRMLISRGHNDFFHYDLVLGWKHSINPIVFSKENFKTVGGTCPRTRCLASAPDLGST